MNPSILAVLCLALACGPAAAKSAIDNDSTPPLPSLTGGAAGSSNRSVVLIKDGSGTTTCLGVSVSPRTILTAAGCASGAGLKTAVFSDNTAAPITRVIEANKGGLAMAAIGQERKGAAAAHESRADLSGSVLQIASMNDALAGSAVRVQVVSVEKGVAKVSPLPPVASLCALAGAPAFLENGGAAGPVVGVAVKSANGECTAVTLLPPGDPAGGDAVTAGIEELKWTDRVGGCGGSGYWDCK